MSTWVIYTTKKYRSFTLFPGVEILWKGTVYAETAETLPFHKISTPGN